MKKLNRYLLNRYLLKIRRIVHSIFHSHPIFKNNNNYFLSQFLKKTNGYNISAIDFSEGVTAADFKGNSFLMNFRPGDLIEGAIYVDGCWERHIATLISQILDKSSGVMLDIGANIGANTIPLAVEHSSIKFYCYEPHPKVFHRLESTARDECWSLPHSWQRWGRIRFHCFELLPGCWKSVHRSLRPHLPPEF